MMRQLMDMTQQELANLLCVILVSSGITLGVLSIFPIHFINQDKARELAAVYFSNGISCGLGVNVRQRKAGAQ